MTAPADSAGAEQLEDLNQAVGKHAQSTSLVEFPEFKVSIILHLESIVSEPGFTPDCVQPSSDPGQQASAEQGVSGQAGLTGPLILARLQSNLSLRLPWAGRADV